MFVIVSHDDFLTGQVINPALRSYSRHSDAGRPEQNNAHGENKL